MALLEVKNLCVDYATIDGGFVRAVDNVSFSIKSGESLGLAGESGCGKSTIAYSLLKLHRPPAIISSGSILIQGKNILELSARELEKLRWEEVGIVFQSAMNCLNPVVKIEKQFYEIFKYHNVTTNKKKAKTLSEELLRMVGIPADRLIDYPHQLSGGMRQRVVIAMALALKPKLLILDEPTTALDTVVQREILEKIFELKEKLGFAILFITHDISLMMEVCDNIAIMYAGKLVEKNTAKNILYEPMHPYSDGLKKSFPSLTGEIKKMVGIPGNPLDLRNIPKGCRFQERCFNAIKGKCDEEPVISSVDDGFFYCHNPLKYNKRGVNSE